MEQLTQKLKDGTMELLEVPYPVLNSGQVLVRNHYSVISAGTEGKTVKDARAGFLGKALARKEEVKKVIKTAQTIGWMKTYKLVMNKLDAPSGLGYSCAGEIIDVAPDIKNFQVGDWVACGGNTANHSEVVAISENLCVKVNEKQSLKGAAFTTLGAIAMQGVRQADLRLGENAVVIGLGIVGQLTMQLLKAGGIAPIGIDLNKDLVESINQQNIGHSYTREHPGLEEIILQHTNGFGTDAVIITAATSSVDPINFAGDIARKKGKVIIVGDVGTGFSRKSYYKKELDIRMSSSYGPGRHDADYEEKGRDYPYHHVRWTENRNMQAFVELIENGSINTEKLISHEFDFQEAGKAYQMIYEKSEHFSGIILKYDTQKAISKEISNSVKNAEPGKPVISMVGAGSFAQNFLLPALKGKAILKHLITARANNSKNVADKFGFTHCTNDITIPLDDREVNTIFIATRHNLHGPQVISALKAGKHVFTEKPLCLYPEELEEIKKVYEKGNSLLMVGFNRRFAPLIEEIKKHFKPDLPVAINYRINAGKIPPDHWTQDPEVGGGRIIGEACHFIDLCAYLSNSLIKSVSATTLEDASKNNDTVAIQLHFQNGSIANISYFANGDKKMAKENIEIFGGGKSAVLEDFKSLSIYENEKLNQTKKGQDKGYSQELKLFLQAIETGGQAPIPAKEIFNAMEATFKTLQSIREGGARIHLPD